MSKDWTCANCTVTDEATYPALFDAIIIGAGPAGLTAAIYAARRKMKTLLICGKVGGQMNHCSDIQNWTGIAQSTGPELVDQFFQHVKRVDDDNAQFDLWVREGERVVDVKTRSNEKLKIKNEKFVVETDSGKVFETKTVVCCTGKVPRTLGVPGEKVAMQGNGLSFSATSDAPLYKGKKMVVIGGGNSAMDVTLQLTKYTDDITILTNMDHLMGEGVLQEKVKKHPKVQVRYQVDTKEVLLDEDSKVKGVGCVINGKEEVIDCEGIFEEIGQSPSTDFIKDIVKLNQGKEIPTDRRCRSAVPGIFAAGDCSDQVHKQVIVAAGEGAVAALEAHEYLLQSSVW